MILISCIQILVTFISAEVLGRCAFRKSRPFEHPYLNTVSAVCLGLLVFSILFFVLGHLKLIYPAVLYGLFGVMIFASLFRGYLLFKNRSSFQFGFSKAWAGLFVFFAAIQLMYCFLPAAIRDEVIYHLAVPKEILKAKGFVLFPDNIYAYFPFFSEWFFTFGLGVSGEAYSKLFHCVTGLLLAGAIAASAKDFFSVHKGVYAALIFLTLPSVMVTMNWAYVDLTFSLYFFMGFLCVLSYVETPKLKSAFLAGVFFGGAASIKYTGIQCTVLMTAFLLVYKLRVKNIRFLDIVCMSLTAALIASPYYVRNFIFTGWPLFPFHVLGLELREGFHWSPERAQLFIQWMQAFGTTLGHAHISDNLLAPIKVFLWGAFNESDRYEGILTPFFLLIPLFWIQKKPHEKQRPLILFSAAFLMYWAFTTKQIRFLFPVLPFLSLLLVYHIERMRKVFVWVVLSLVVSLNVGFAIPELHKKNILLGLQPSMRDVYLDQQTGVYSVYKRFEGLMGDEAKVYLLGAKNYVYFLDRLWRSDFVFERHGVEEALDKQKNVRGLAEHFNRSGATHLMVDYKMFFSPRFGIESPNKEIFFRYLKRKTKVMAIQGSYILHEIKKKKESV